MKNEVKIKWEVLNKIKETTEGRWKARRRNVKLTRSKRWKRK